LDANIAKERERESRKDAAAAGLMPTAPTYT